MAKKQKGELNMIMNDVNQFLVNFGAEQREIDYNSLKGFVVTVCPRHDILQFIGYCKKHIMEEKLGDKTAIKRFSVRFMHAFMNTASHNPRPIDDQARFMKALIMDYYFDTFLDDTLLPYIERNAEGEKSRAQLRLMKYKRLYNDLNNANDVRVIQEAQQEYDERCQFADRDWRAEFDTIHQITAEIKANEMFNERITAGRYGGGV